MEQSGWATMTLDDIKNALERMRTWVDRPAARIMLGRHFDLLMEDPWFRTRYNRENNADSDEEVDRDAHPTERTREILRWYGLPSG